MYAEFLYPFLVKNNRICVSVIGNRWIDMVLFYSVVSHIGPGYVYNIFFKEGNTNLPGKSAQEKNYPPPPPNFFSFSF